jgi:gamma-glutamylcysteine synthetase
MTPAQLAARFNDSFPEKVSWRTVGREAEHPVVNPDGTAGDVDRLWQHLASGMRVQRQGDLIVGLEGEHWSYSLEVGRGTVEIITAPRPDLHALRDVYEPARDRVLEACLREDLIMLGYGIQPLTPPTAALMSAKDRYKVLHDALGDLWLWFAVTASDQIHASMARDEWVAVTNVCNLLAPVVVALTANSPVYNGEISPFSSGREGAMGQIGADSHRHGMTPGPIQDPLDHVNRLLRLDHLMASVNGDRVLCSGPFSQWLDDHPSTAWPDFLHHEHYAWHTARPRSGHGTIEIRAACQQPPQEHMAAAALCFGLMCAARPLAAWLDKLLGPDAWPIMHRWHAQVIKKGLQAREPAEGLLDGVLEHIEVAFTARGRGECVYLEPLRARVATRRSPAHHAAAAFLDGGIDSLLPLVACR